VSTNGSQRILVDVAITSIRQQSSGRIVGISLLINNTLLVAQSFNGDCAGRYDIFFVLFCV
jgi:hypothetical protein